MTAGRSNRRGFLFLGGAGVLLIAAPRIYDALSPLPETEPHPNVEGFRRLAEADLTPAANPFVGLPDDNPDRIDAVEVTDICAELYRDGRRDGTAPVAFFTDINCPYCRLMEPDISALSPDRASVTWHDLPILGASSFTAARAIKAAGLQGAEAAMRSRLHQTQFRPEQGYLRRVAANLDLDADRLLADMDTDAVTTPIARTLGLSARFAFPGTPSTVIGDIAASGRRREGQIDALVNVMQDTPMPCA